MIYGMREFWLQSMRPLHLMAEAGHNTIQAWGNIAGLIPGMQHTSAACALVSRLTRDYQKPEFHINETVVDGHPVAVHEAVRASLPFGRLLHFEKQGVHKPGPKVLLVAPMSGHFATLLRPTVLALLPEHDVYITDWTDTRYVPKSAGAFDLGSYVDYLRHFLTVLGPETHVVAVCQPSVPVLAAVSLMAEDEDPNQPRSMTLIAGPIDTRISPTKVNQFSRRHNLAWFKRHVIEHVPLGYPGAGRKVYPGFMQLAGFMSMNMGRHVDSHIKYFRAVSNGNHDHAAQHRRFYDEYNAVMDLPAEFYLETIQKVFIEHHLPRGVLGVGGRQVDPTAIRNVALQTIEGGRDDITGRGQTEAAHGLCSNIPQDKRRHLLVEGVGHYGTFDGTRFRQEILPAITGFVRAHEAV